MNQIPPPPAVPVSWSQVKHNRDLLCHTFLPFWLQFRNTTPHDKQNLHQTANYAAKHYLFRSMSAPCMYAQVSSVDPWKPRVKARELFSRVCRRGDLGVQLSLRRLWASHWRLLMSPGLESLLFCSTKGLASRYRLLLKAFLLCPVC